MKTVVVTGATSGIGFAVCRELLHAGFRVLGIGRSKSRCDDALKSLGVHSEHMTFFCADLVSLQDVKRVGREIGIYLDSCANGELFALINNAGGVRSYYTTTKEGYEQQFTLNHLSSFLLTHCLFPNLQRGEGRVLFTSSNSHKGMKIHWDDIMFSKRYNPLLAYKQSKLCNVLFAYSLKSYLPAYAVDPGLVKTEIGHKETSGLVNLFWSFRMRGGVAPSIPAKTYWYLLTQENPEEGLYYYLCEEKKHSIEVNRENADRLFALSQKLCGIKTFGRVE